MNKGWLAVMLCAIAMALVTTDDAVARRLGSGRSIGDQRQNAAPRTPAQPEAVPRTAEPPAQPPAAVPQRGRGFLGPFAGVALGLGLAQLFGHDVGNALAALLCAGILVAAVVFLMRLVLRPRASAAAAGSGGSQYSSFGEETVPAPPPSQLMTQPIVAAQLMRPRTRVPEGFNIEGFVREAKRNFIELYAAHDRGDLATLREFTTDEMFAELKRDIDQRPAAVQGVDIVTLGADLLEVVTEVDTHWASIRFSGMLREDRNAPPTAFEEVWNLRKPVKGRGGWVLAGIQQLG